MKMRPAYCDACGHRVATLAFDGSGRVGVELMHRPDPVPHIAPLAERRRAHDRFIVDAGDEVVVTCEGCLRLRVFTAAPGSGAIRTKPW